MGLAVAGSVRAKIRGRFAICNSAGDAGPSPVPLSDRRRRPPRRVRPFQRPKTLRTGPGLGVEDRTRPVRRVNRASSASHSPTLSGDSNHKVRQANHLVGRFRREWRRYSHSALNCLNIHLECSIICLSEDIFLCKLKLSCSFGEDLTVLRTITIGSCVSIQGTFIRTLPDGRIAIRDGQKVYEGRPVSKAS